MAETQRRREKQHAWNLEHGITPESIRSNIKDILASPYEKQGRINVDAGVAEDARPFLGSNFQATLRDLETKMRESAANLEFEAAARIRDEIKRLKMLDLEFANEVMTGAGETADKDVVKRERDTYRARYAARPKRGGKR